MTMYLSLDRVKEVIQERSMFMLVGLLLRPMVSPISEACSQLHPFHRVQCEYTQSPRCSTARLVHIVPLEP